MVVPIALAALRSLAVRQAANATAKIRRLEKQGIHLAGSTYDPRRDAKNIAKYNRKQLQTYTAQLSEFTKRSTKFIKGPMGAPISMMDFSRYKNAETLYNLAGDRLRRRNAALPLPGEDVTVEEGRMGDAKSFINAPDNTILPKVVRGPESFPSADALRKSRNLLTRRMGSAYVNFRKRSTIQGLNRAFNKMGANDVAERFNDLPEEAKHYLIFDTGFVDNVYQAYPADGETGSLADNENILMSVIAHAETLFSDVA